MKKNELVSLKALGDALKLGTISPDSAVKIMTAKILDDIRSELADIAVRIVDAAERIGREKEFVMEIERNSRTQLITQVKIKPVKKSEAPETALTRRS